VRFGFRVPSFRKRFAARTSLKRAAQNVFGYRVPRGWGWVTSQRKAAYNRVYNRTSGGCAGCSGCGCGTVIILALFLLLFNSC